MRQLTANGWANGFPVRRNGKKQRVAQTLGYALYPSTILPKDARGPVGEPVIRGGRLYYSSKPPNMSHLLYRTALRHGVRGFQGSDPDNQEGFRCARGAEPAPLSEAIVSTTAPQPLPTASGVDLEQMVLIPAGEFMMGTDEAERPGDLTLTSARPAHLVDLDEFYIERYEVTWQEFIEYLNQLGKHELACAGEDCVGTFQSPSDSKRNRILKKIRVILRFVVRCPKELLASANFTVH